MFFEGHLPEIIILLLIMVLVFGPGRLPEVGAALGRGIREFRDATSGAPAATQPPAIDQSPPAQPPLQLPAGQQAPERAPREPVAAEQRGEDR